jgi:aryl-alcohol dehydrogenase-like predicted oxidoreductase
MTEFSGQVVLGRSGLKVGRLGVSGGYKAPAGALEMAFERGCNYFYHGSVRRDGMTTAIKNICSAGKRDRLVVVAQSYTRWSWQLRRSLEKFLKLTGLDYADVLLLGWFNSSPSERLLETCEELRVKGMFNHLAVSGHNRPSFPIYAKDSRYGLFHIRYNAAHRGAEREVFPLMPQDRRPGVVIYTATRWGKLLKPRGLPAGTAVPRGSDCYRFVLSNPGVDVCMTGPKDMDQMKEALCALDRGPMTPDELDWMRRVGDVVHASRLPF